jgi:hypothetical protein
MAAHSLGRDGLNIAARNIAAEESGVSCQLDSARSDIAA